MIIDNYACYVIISFLYQLCHHVYIPFQFTSKLNEFVRPKLRASVEKILTTGTGDNVTAVGVRLKSGMEIKAKNVVSAAGYGEILTVFSP